MALSDMIKQRLQEAKEKKIISESKAEQNIAHALKRDAYDKSAKAFAASATHEGNDHSEPSDLHHAASMAHRSCVHYSESRHEDPSNVHEHDKLWKSHVQIGQDHDDAHNV